MANNNSVLITLSAKDNASGVFKGLTGLIEGATLRANLLANVLSEGLSKGVSALSSKFKEAADIQLNNITAASTYAALTGRNFADAEKVFSVLDGRINKIASSLPGSTEEYKRLALGIQDNLIPAFVDANGVFDEAGFLDGLTEITRGMGFLSAASNVASKDVSKFTAKFLGGSSISELSKLLFAEANPAFLSLVEKKLTASGKKLEQLTTKERKQILEAVQAELVTEDTIKAASNSVSGLLESLKDKLFNPSQGIFGLLKDLDEKTDGNQSVLNAFNDTLKALLGDNGLFNTVGSLLDKLGIDPNFILKSVRGGVEGITKWIEELNASLSFINSSSINGDALNAKFTSFVSNIFNITGLGKKLGDIFNQGIDQLKSLNWNSIFTNLGLKLTQVIGEVFSFLKTLNLDSIVSVLGESLSELFKGLGSFLTSKDWGKELADIVNKAFQALAKLDWANIFNGLGKVLADVLNTVLSFLKNIDSGAIFDTFVGIIVGAFQGLGNFLLRIDWGTTVEILKKGIITPFEMLGRLVGKMVDETVYFLENILNKITGKDNTPEDLGRRANEIAADPTLSREEKARQIRETMPNRASGQGFDSLMSAIGREQKAAPSGAGIVIANSTEAILNRQQQSQLVSSVGSKGNLTIGSIVIQTQATNAQEIADKVMQVINDEFTKYTQYNLASAA